MAFSPKPVLQKIIEHKIYLYDKKKFKFKQAKVRSMKHLLLASFISLLCSGCVVKEEPYHHHHHYHHDRVYIEDRPVIEERVHVD